MLEKIKDLQWHFHLLMLVALAALIYGGVYYFITGPTREEIATLNDQISVGDAIETAGIQSSTVPGSYFPRRIPVGRVTKADPDELQTSQQVHIKPFANLRDLEVVQVLTDTGAA